MVLFVLTIGLLNLAIGFSIGLFVHHWPQARRPVAVKEPQPLPVVQAPAPVRAIPKKKEPEDDFGLPPLEEELRTEDIPEEWLDLLDSTEVANSFVEASIQVLKLEVGKYRDRLVQVENQVRALPAEPAGELVGECLLILKQVNEDWLERQSQATEYLQERQGSLGELAAMGARLEDILMEQTAQIETTCSNIDHLNHLEDPAATCRRVVPEITRLLQMAHDLRDRMQESMASVLAQEGRLATLDKQRLLDTLTGVRNRTGVEQLYENWWAGDPGRTRLLSVAIVDVDHFTRINEQLGAIGSDRLLATLAGLLEELMNEERSDHVVARLNGQQFLFFFADCGPRHATSTIERIRQTVHVTSFELEGAELELTVSGGVVELKAGDNTSGMLSRAAKTLAAAKKAGRNRTFLEEDAGPAAVEPPEFKVKARVIRVAADE